VAKGKQQTDPHAALAAEYRPDPEDFCDAEGLTVRQRLFIDHLLGDAGGNATKAAALAGYASDNRQSLNQMASRLLSYVKVRESIARRMARANLTADWLKEMTAALAASNMGTFLSLGDDGEPRLDWKQAERLGAFVQIRKYKEKGIKSVNPDGETKVDVVERTIETHNPAPYLNLMARLLGLVNDGAQQVTVQHEHEHRVTVDYDAIETEIRGILGRCAVAGRAPADRIR
jgi:hypothetical protein